MTLSHAERGRMGGKARVANQTPEQRRELASRAHLAMAVKAVVDRAPELTPDQLDRLRTLFTEGR